MYIDYIYINDKWSVGIVFIEFCWSFRQEIGASPVIATGARMESQSFRVHWAVNRG